MATKDCKGADIRKVCAEKMLRHFTLSRGKSDVARDDVTNDQLRKIVVKPFIEVFHTVAKFAVLQWTSVINCKSAAQQISTSLVYLVFAVPCRPEVS